MDYVKNDLERLNLGCRGWHGRAIVEWGRREEAEKWWADLYFDMESRHHPTITGSTSWRHLPEKDNLGTGVEPTEAGGKAEPNPTTRIDTFYLRS